MYKKVLFLGSKKLGLSILKTIYHLSGNSLKCIVTFNDSNDERSCLSKFKSFSNENEIPLYIAEKPSELKDVLLHWKPDLVMVIGWYWIISDHLLNMVPNGFVGIHGSLLPKYRGFAPFVWAIINGENETGVSLFYFDNEIDNGDIISQETITIKQNDTISDVLNEAEQHSVKIIEKNYPLLLTDSAPRLKQKTENVSYCSLRKPEDGQIKWDIPSNEIHNFIRAQSSPYPGAFTFLNGEKYYILKANVFEGEYFGVPGVVAQKMANKIIVCCGKGAIIISNVCVENDKSNKISSITFGDKFQSML